MHVTEAGGHGRDLGEPHHMRGAEGILILSFSIEGPVGEVNVMVKAEVTNADGRDGDEHAVEQDRLPWVGYEGEVKEGPVSVEVKGEPIRDEGAHCIEEGGTPFIRGGFDFGGGAGHGGDGDSGGSRWGDGEGREGWEVR